MKTKFSIITICYNEEAGIRRTCESIVNQTFSGYEWIVIDGGSSDATLEVLREYESSIDFLVSEPDEGIYDAMNKGIARANGEYLIFMNGGDAFASQAVLEWVAAVPQRDLIYGDIFFDKVGGDTAIYPDAMSNGYLLKNMVPHQATFYRRALFEKFGKYDTSYRIAADYDLYVRLLEVGKVDHYHLNKPLAVFDLNGISNNRDYRLLRKQENHRVRMKYFPQYRRSLKAWRQICRNLLKKA